MTERAIVRELKEDSSNIIDVVLEAYDTLRSVVSVNFDGLPNGVILKNLKSWCDGSEVPIENELKCKNVKIKGEL